MMRTKQGRRKTLFSCMQRKERRKVMVLGIFFFFFFCSILEPLARRESIKWSWDLEITIEKWCKERVVTFENFDLTLMAKWRWRSRGSNHKINNWVIIYIIPISLFLLAHYLLPFKPISIFCMKSKSINS